MFARARQADQCADMAALPRVRRRLSPIALRAFGGRLADMLRISVLHPPPCPKPGRRSLRS